ncbi:MAG: prolipoprotein diacylglyceryl transferase [Alphaproteobacteria bacterium]|nr:prolipoprotein diacylglyceryl transferase [Alphaproteobacteria bacterium]
MHLSPVALDLGFFKIRWYALAYISGILLAWWYINRLIAQPGAPMAKRHTEDLVFYATLGVILGGRLGYAIFYASVTGDMMIFSPAHLIRVWEGGMSFHGGAIGVLLAMLWVARRNKVNLLRVMDYISCGVPIGLFLGRCANFINGELWGRPTQVPWAMIFPEAGPEPRHPSQLYEAGLEGIFLFSLLALLFWRTSARLKPGLLSGVFILGYGLIRILLENVREPDKGLEHLSWGLTMGQTLSIPMVLAGAFLIVRALRGKHERPDAG